jgi:S1-C subfamily serine protease
MRKVLLFLLFCLAVLIPCQVKSKTLTPAEAVINHSAGVVVPMLGQAIGSGVFLIVDGKPAVLTAKHVAEAVGPIPVTFCTYAGDCTEKLYSSFISGKTDSLADDWAIYFIDSFPEGISPAILSRNNPRIGSSTWTSGIAGGVNRLIIKGQIAWIDFYKDKSMIKVFGYAMPGFSGGGVYNKKGYLIGIVSAIATQADGTLQENIVFVVPVSNIFSS